MSTDLFGGEIPAPPPPPMVHLHPEVLWTRLDAVKRPTCGHCTMLLHYNQDVQPHKARWVRTGVEGSVLELCDIHKIHQVQRDKHADSLVRVAEAYEVLVHGIVDTMADPLRWDDMEQDEVYILLAYVQTLAGAAAPATNDEGAEA